MRVAEGIKRAKLYGCVAIGQELGAIHEGQPGAHCDQCQEMPRQEVPASRGDSASCLASGCLTTGEYLITKRKSQIPPAK